MSLYWLPTTLPGETVGEIVNRITAVDPEIDDEHVEIYCPYEPDPFYLPNAKRFTVLSTHSINYRDEHDGMIPLAMEVGRDPGTGEKVIRFLLSMQDAIGTECWLDDEEI